MPEPSMDQSVPQNTYIYYDSQHFHMSSKATSLPTTGPIKALAKDDEHVFRGMQFKTYFCRRWVTVGCVHREGRTFIGQTWCTSNTLLEGSDSLLNTLKENSLEIPQSPEYQLLDAPSCPHNSRGILL